MIGYIVMGIHRFKVFEKYLLLLLPELKQVYFDGDLKCQ